MEDKFLSNDSLVTGKCAVFGCEDKIGLIILGQEKPLRLFCENHYWMRVRGK